MIFEKKNTADLLPADYECVLKYPITGALYKEICTERLVKAKPNDTSKDQMFRIYRISTPIKRNALGGAVATSNDGIVGKACKCCGAPMIQIPGRKPRLFCSDACRTKWWNAHPELVKHRGDRQIICAHCGKVFGATENSTRKYCSHGCYIADRFHGGELQ